MTSTITFSSVTGVLAEALMERTGKIKHISELPDGVGIWRKSRRAKGYKKISIGDIISEGDLIALVVEEPQTTQVSYDVLKVPRKRSSAGRTVRPGSDSR